MSTAQDILKRLMAENPKASKRELAKEFAELICNEPALREAIIREWWADELEMRRRKKAARAKRQGSKKA